MPRLGAAQWLGRLRAKGWTRDQIQQATGASPSTQQRLQSGRQKSTRYESQIRDAGSKYSRRKEPPPEFEHRAPLSRVLKDLAAAGIGINPDAGELDDLKERFGAAGRLAILRGQLRAYRYKHDTGSARQPSWFFVEGPELMRHYDRDEGEFDPYQFIKQLWYGGRS